MLSFILPILSVFLGFAIVYFLKLKQTKTFKLLLAFSGAFLLSITVFDFLPEVFMSKNKNIGVFIMLGILLQIILEFFSKGAEHGHVHLNKNAAQFPWLLFLSLSIHSVLEGVPLHAHHNLVYGIVVHKLPVAIILSTVLLSTQIKLLYSLLFIVLFALMTPFGVFLSENSAFIKIHYSKIAAVVIGIFLHISTTILFESNEGHKFNLGKLLTIVLAIVLAYFL